MALPVKVGSEFTVHTLTSTQPTEILPVVLRNGGFALFWTSVDAALDASFTGVFARFYNAAGSALGPVMLVNTKTAGNQSLPDVATLDNGDLIVAWAGDDQATPPAGTFNFGPEPVAQILSQTGAKIGGEIVLPASPFGAEQPNASAAPELIAARVGGGYASAWVDFPGGIASGAGTVSLQMRVFDASGVGGADIVVAQFGGLTSFDRVDIDATPDGRYFVSWRERIDASNRQTKGQFFDAAGAAQGAAFNIGTPERNAWKGLVEPIAADRLVYVYEVPASQSYFAVVLNAAGVAVSTPVRLGTGTDSRGDIGSIVVRPDGGFVVTWTDTQFVSGETNDVFMQNFFANGTADGAPIKLSGPPDGSETGGTSSPIVNGQMLSAWFNGFNLKAQLFTFAPQGTDGPDALDGTPGNDSLAGLGGNDTINGLAGDDTLAGGAGDDTLDGGDGADMADFSGATAGLTLTTQAGEQVVAAPGLGSDTLRNMEGYRGGAFADSFTGDARSNVFDGGGGADVIVGNDGADTIEAGGSTAGYDVLYGGGGNDAISKNGTSLTPGSFYAEGNEGSDTFIVDASVDAMLFDYLFADAADGSGTGADVVFKTGAGRLYVSGGGGNDTIAGGDATLSGDAVVEYLFGDFGADSISGGGGLDVLVGSNYVTTAGDAPTGTLVDTLNGGAGPDWVLQGLWGRGVLDGGTGNDTIVGAAGADVIRMGQGDDFAYGGGGGDRFEVSAGELQAGATDRIIDFYLPGSQLIFTGVSASQVAFSQVPVDVSGVTYQFGLATIAVGGGAHTIVAGYVTAGQLQAATSFL